MELESYHYDGYDRSLKEMFPVEEITVEDGVTIIRSTAFWSMINLKKINLPASLQEIEVWAIVNCYSLKEVHFCGTEKQWKKVHKPRNWHHNSGKPVVTFEN